jgi:DNA-binding CsgD family transcriptional regulator
MARKEGYRWRRRGWRPNDRQREVLDLLAEGKSNAEIAVRLGITLDGAKWHVSELLAETGCADRRALAAWWREERDVGRGARVFGPLLLRLAVAGAGVATVAMLLALVAALSDGEPGPASPEASAGATPTPRPDEALEALAASQGPPPATCEPPEAQDLRIVDPSELAALGLLAAGRVIIDGHCPLYVANRADRAVVWAGGGGLLHIDLQTDGRLMSADGCCAQALLPLVGVNYHLSGSGWSELNAQASMTGSFTKLDQELARIESIDPNGAYVILTLREATPTPNRLGHRVAIASDGQMFIDPLPLAGDVVTNGLTGETIDVSGFGPGMPLSVEVGTGAVRTDCWEKDGICRVYLDGLRGTRDVDLFNPSTVLAPFDGVLNCVRVDGEFFSIDGPALAYELSSGPLVLRFGAFGGAWEEWEACKPRDLRRGQDIPVWTYTYVEAYVDGEPRSIVSTRDGRLFVGHVALELGCPCEPRS